MHINTSSPQPELTQPNKASELQQLLEKIKAKLKHPQVVFALVVGFILFAGLGLTLVQMRQSTENRSQASGGDKPQVQLSSTNDLSHPQFSATKAPGEEFTLYLHLNSHNHQLIAGDIVVTYPADKLQLTAGPEINSASNYAVTKTTHRETGDRGLARVLIGARPGHPLSQVVQVGQIKFKVKDDAPDANINITISANGTKLAPKTGDIITGNALEVQNFGLNISRPDQNCSFDANVCNNEAALKIPKSECLALKDLYCYTKGDGWAHKDNWGTATDVNKWYGVDTDNQHVKKIDLNNNNLNGTLASSIDALSEVQELNFTGGNHITTIPNTITRLHKLKALGLGGVNLTGSIPNLSTLSELQALDLSRNNLSYCNISQIPSNMKWMHIGSNHSLSGQVDWSLPNGLEVLIIADTQLTGTVCGPEPSQEFKLNYKVQYSETCTNPTATPTPTPPAGATATPTPVHNATITPPPTRTPSATPTQPARSACDLPAKVASIRRDTNNQKFSWTKPRGCTSNDPVYYWWQVTDDQATDVNGDGQVDYSDKLVTSSWKDNAPNTTPHTPSNLCQNRSGHTLKLYVFAAGSSKENAVSWQGLTDKSVVQSSHLLCP